jgi:hypothetical protein
MKELHIACCNLIGWPSMRNQLDLPDVNVSVRRRYCHVSFHELTSRGRARQPSASRSPYTTRRTATATAKCNKFFGYRTRTNIKIDIYSRSCSNLAIWPLTAHVFVPCLSLRRGRYITSTDHEIAKVFSVESLEGIPFDDGPENG